MALMKRATTLRPMVAAICIALAVPGIALAQTSKEQEQDARIQHLEAELQAMKDLLMANQAAIAAPAAPAVAAQPAAPAAPAPASGPAAPIQKTTILTAAAPDSRFSFGGFIKLDAMSTWTGDGEIPDATPGRMFYFPAGTPVGGDSHSYNDFHAQFSRVWFGVDRKTEEGDTFKAMVEFDFFGGGNTNVGNEKFSNGYPPTLRHAYVGWNNWLAGQTWSNFMDLASLPETVDFVGVVDGTVFVRQAQIRYTKGPWSVSLENPQTWYQAGSPAHINAGSNNVPDITARWQKRGDWGHFSVAGLVRQIKANDDTLAGGGVSIAGSFNLGDSDSLQYMVSGGPGIGRYLAFGLGPDAYLDVDGSLEAQDMVAGFAGWRHNFSPKLRSTLAYSTSRIDTDAAAIGPAATRNTQSVRANLIYSPFPKLDVGAEISWAERELSNGDTGDLKRLHTTVKYSF